MTIVTSIRCAVMETMQPHVSVKIILIMVKSFLAVIAFLITLETVLIGEKFTLCYNKTGGKKCESFGIEN